MDIKAVNWSGTAVHHVGLAIRQKVPITSKSHSVSPAISSRRLNYSTYENHFPRPQIDPAAHRLAIAGAKETERPGAGCRHRLSRREQSRTRKAGRLAVDRSGRLLIADDVGISRVSSVPPGSAKPAS